MLDQAEVRPDRQRLKKKNGTSGISTTFNGLDGGMVVSQPLSMV
jgi:hypothetical protein